MVYYRKVLSSQKEIGKAVQKLATTYNRINIYLAGSHKHIEHQLKEDAALIIAHKQKF